VRILGIVYPSLDLRRVSFHRGLPHLLDWTGHMAITLPSLAPRGGRVYVRSSAWDPGSVDGLGLVLHEGFHLLQLQESGWGLGLARPFVVLYLACAAANRFRYRDHPMESDAYRVAGRRRSRFETSVDPALLPSRYLAGEPAGEPDCGCPDLADFARCCAPAVAEASGVAFWRKLAASTPGYAPLARAARRLASPQVDRPGRLAFFAGAAVLAALAGFLASLWLLLWWAVAALLALGELLVLAAGALAYGAVAVVAGMAGLARFAPALVKRSSGR